MASGQWVLSCLNKNRWKETVWSAFWRPQWESSWGDGFYGKVGWWCRFSDVSGFISASVIWWVGALCHSFSSSFFLSLIFLKVNFLLHLKIKQIKSSSFLASGAQQASEQICHRPFSALELIQRWNCSGGCNRDKRGWPSLKKKKKRICFSLTAPQERSNRIKIFKLTRTKIDDLIFSANLVMSNQVAPEVWSINLWRVDGISHFGPFGVTVGTVLSLRMMDSQGFPNAY